MGKRFIPNGDTDFRQMADGFSATVARDPHRYGVGDEDARVMRAAVEEYMAAYQASKYGSRSDATIRAKDAARAVAERLIKRVANVIRINENIDSETLYKIGMKRSDGRRKARTCPQEPPSLRFVRSLHASATAMPIHELRFRAQGACTSKAKPAGASRLELFVDLVGPDEPIPQHPGENFGGRPWYLRSYSRSPIKLSPPVARVPMLVVYWARWADATGNVGPFCRTVVSRVEGVSSTMLSVNRMKFLEAAPEQREQKYSVAVRDAQYEYLNPQVEVPAAETPQLEGPEEKEAA